MNLDANLTGFGSIFCNIKDPKFVARHIVNQPANGRESHELNKNGPFVHRTKNKTKKTKKTKKKKKNSWI